ncbi:MAG: hypothetical protein KDA89_00455, partial [Planctomycetaceae bacterium]|nr:hypothetical protein [Planctomycetaceae bacterium]
FTALGEALFGGCLKTVIYDRCEPPSPDAVVENGRHSPTRPLDGTGPRNYIAPRCLLTESGETRPSLRSIFRDSHRPQFSGQCLTT